MFYSQSNNASLTQKQGFKFTQNQQFSLKILQSSNSEIINIINQELQINPFMQEDETISPLYDENTIDDGDSDGDDGDNIDIRINLMDAMNSNSIVSNPLNMPKDSDLGIENIPEEAVSLREHLLQQIYMEFNLDDKEKEIAEAMLYFLDEYGFFKPEGSDIASNLDISEPELGAVLQKLTSLDPVGVFSNGYTDFFAIQLREKGLLNDDYQLLLQAMEQYRMEEYAEEMSDGGVGGEIDGGIGEEQGVEAGLELQRDSSKEVFEKSAGNNKGARVYSIKSLSGRTGVSVKKTKDFLQAVKQLKPYPAFGFAKERIIAENIDIFSRVTEDGKIIVEINRRNIPKFTINKEYYNSIKNHSTSGQDMIYVKQKYEDAKNFYSAINRRRDTLKAIVNEIIIEQKDFFLRGIKYIRPLTMSELAKKIDMSEATISRAVLNKRMLTPFGSIPLKMFFSAKLQHIIADSSFSATSVKYLVKEIVSKEHLQGKILSDDEIAEALQEKGVKISRRTVAKYRQHMNIKSSFERAKEQAQ